MMRLLILFTLIYNSVSQFPFYEGNLCRTNRFEGQCRLLEDCPTVNAEMVAGKSPELICGFVGYEVVVCCPVNYLVIDRDINLTSAPSTTTAKTTTFITNSSKSQSARKIAQEKCAEYSKSAYKTVIPPILSMNKKPINVSTCKSMPGVLYVAGGTKSESRKHPHIAAIGFDSNNDVKWLCGGTLISDTFVLTAAHCLYSTSWGSASWVRLGDLNLQNDDDDANPQTFRIAQRIRHPDYKPSSLYHDIALLKLDGEVQFDDWIRPACLPSIETQENEYGIAAGWGKVDWLDDEGSNDLLEVILKVVPNERCNSFYGNENDKLKHGVVLNWQICAGERGKDTCQGDSGGPLIVVNNRHSCIYDVIGVTSFGRPCGSFAPGIYTRVSHYISWIQKIIWP